MYKIDKCPWTQEFILRNEKKIKLSASYITAKKIMDFLLIQPREEDTNFILLPFIETIAKSVKRDRRTVIRYLKEWEQQMRIKKHKGKSNSIRIEILDYRPDQKMTKIQKSIFENKIADCLREANLAFINNESE